MSISQKIVFKVLASGGLPYPKTMMIDPANVCQLKCPLCSTGKRTLNYDCKMMPLALFRKIVNKAPFIQDIELFKNGEPFLNPEIFEMTRYASDRGIIVSISTNFSFDQPDSFFEKIVTSGLAKLIVSMDGASQQSYSRYRQGGDYELVLGNIKKLIAAKKKHQRSTPEIVWQFLVNRFNEHEIDLGRALCLDLGVSLDVQPMGLADDLPDVRISDSIADRKKEWLPGNPAYISDCYLGEYRYPLFKGICSQLFTRIVVTVDGKVLPCCFAEDRASVFGDLDTESFDEIWHGPKYLSARLSFLAPDMTPAVQTVCHGCHNFGKRPTLSDKIQLALAVLRKT